MWELSYNYQACFDMMHHETSNSLAWRQGVQKCLLEAQSKVINGLQLHVRMSL